MNMEEKDKKANQEELKKRLHELIDNIEDKHIKMTLNEDVIEYVIQAWNEETDGDEDEMDDDLTEEQEQELDEAVKEADEGKTISQEEFKKRMSRWLTD
jgi:hypothetical protein